MRAGAALAFLLALAAPTFAEDHARRVNVVQAILVDPTDRYGTEVLGDAAAWSGLRITFRQCARCRGPDLRDVILTLPETRVFDAVDPLVADVDGDGLREVLVVETDLAQGPSLAVFGPGGKRAATPFLGGVDGRLTPAGVGDFDGDGRPEIAFVIRTHERQELIFLRLTEDRLAGIARFKGLLNPRTGNWTSDTAIRTCSGLAEVILPDAAGKRLVAVRLDGTRIVTRDAGPYLGADSLSLAAAAC